MHLKSSIRNYCGLNQSEKMETEDLFGDIRAHAMVKPKTWWPAMNRRLTSKEASGRRLNEGSDVYDKNW